MKSVTDVIKEMEDDRAEGRRAVAAARLAMLLDMELDAAFDYEAGASSSFCTASLTRP